MGRSYYYQLPYDKWLARNKFIKQPTLVKAVAFICLLKMAASPLKGNLLDECKRPYPLDELAEIVKCSPKELGDSLLALKDIGIFDMKGNPEKPGSIWFTCPEMMDAESDRNKYKEFGKRGGRPRKTPL